jgi:MFS transporter, DHA1 family, multidrug resistance protein
VFHHPEWLAIVFPCVASTMALASFFNARMVMRVGMRRISHTALIGVVLFAGMHLAIGVLELENIWSFVLLQALMMGCMGLATSNFSAMAMERMGEIAGTASSLQGFVTTLGSALIGAVVGQSFNGTTIPLYAGFVVTGLMALLVVAITERGRLFRSS